MGSPGVQELLAAASPTTHAASPGVFAGFSVATPNLKKVEAGKIW